MNIILLTGVFGNAPTNPALFVAAFVGAVVWHGVLSIFKKKK